MVSVQAPLLLSLNGSMRYLGIARGAVVSGSLIGHLDLSQLSWVGVPFGLLALGTLAFAHTPPRPRVTAATLSPGNTGNPCMLRGLWRLLVSRPWSVLSVTF